MSTAISYKMRNYKLLLNWSRRHKKTPHLRGLDVVLWIRMLPTLLCQDLASLRFWFACLKALHTPLGNPAAVST